MEVSGEMAIMQMKGEVEFKSILASLKKMLSQKVTMAQDRLSLTVNHLKRNLSAQLTTLYQVLLPIVTKTKEVRQEKKILFIAQTNPITKTKKE